MSYAHATVTASTLNVRRASEPGAEPVGALRRGATVQVLGRAGAWYEVDDGIVHGFVSGDYLRFDSTPTADGFLCHDDHLCAAPLPPERRVSAGGGALSQTVARAWNRYGGVLSPLCAAAGIAPAVALAVLCVESSGQGITDSGRLVIRFENHVFWDRWGKAHPTAYRERFTFNGERRWTGHRFRGSAAEAWRTGHAGQDAEWAAFGIARRLDETAALESISMGASQIMGFNHAAIGYDSVQEMFARFSEDERYQVLGLFDFVKGGARTSRMLEALRREEFDRFATYYNGNGQAAVYGARIRAAADAFERLTLG